MGHIIFLPEHFIYNMVTQGCRQMKAEGQKMRFL